MEVFPQPAQAERNINLYSVKEFSSALRNLRGTVIRRGFNRIPPFLTHIMGAYGAHCIGGTPYAIMIRCPSLSGLWVRVLCTV